MLETTDTLPYQALLSSTEVQQIYLDELGTAAECSIGLRIVQLIIQRQETAIESARALIKPLMIY